LFPRSSRIFFRQGPVFAFFAFPGCWLRTQFLLDWQHEDGIAMENSRPGDEVAETKKEDAFLNFRSSVRPYGPDELDQIFLDMHDESDKPWDARKFGQAARALGTHAPKMISTRLSGEALPPLTIQSGTGNEPSPLYYSGNAALGSYAKVLLRPIAILGDAGEGNFVERMIAGDPHSADLRKAFIGVFGQEAMDEIDAGLAARHDPERMRALWHDNFPVFFAPDSNGGDMQITPLASVKALDFLGRIRRQRIDTHNEKRKAEMARREVEAKKAKLEGREEAPHLPIPAAGSWSQTITSGKMRNVAMNVSDRRTRFLAVLPDVVQKTEAEIYSWIEKDGPFPRMHDPETAAMMADYAARIIHRKRNPDTYYDANISRGEDQRADTIIARISGFIDDMMEEARRHGEPGAESPERPTILHVISRADLRFDRERAGLGGKDVPKADAIRQVFLGVEFRSRLDKKGETR